MIVRATVSCKVVQYKEGLSLFDLHPDVKLCQPAAEDLRCHPGGFVMMVAAAQVSDIYVLERPRILGVTDNKQQNVGVILLLICFRPFSFVLAKDLSD